MSSTVKFADGTTLTALAVNGSPITLQGARRDSIELQFAEGSITFDALNALTSDSTKTATFTVADDTGTYAKNNYCLQADVGEKPVVVTPASGSDPAVTEKRLYVVLAQLTYDEVQRAAQQEQIDALGQQVVALSLGG